MITVDKGFIASFISKQTVTDQIRSFSKGTFPCISIVVSNMLNNHQTVANFIESYMHIKAIDITPFSMLKTQNCSKSRKMPLVYPYA